MPCSSPVRTAPPPTRSTRPHLAKPDVRSAAHAARRCGSRAGQNPKGHLDGGCCRGRGIAGPQRRAASRPRHGGQRRLDTGTQPAEPQIAEVAADTLPQTPPSDGPVVVTDAPPLAPATEPRVLGRSDFGSGRRMKLKILPPAASECRPNATKHAGLRVGLPLCSSCSRSTWRWWAPGASRKIFAANRIAVFGGRLAGQFASPKIRKHADFKGDTGRTFVPCHRGHNCQRFQQTD